MLSIAFLIISLLMLFIGLFLGKGRFALLIVTISLLSNLASISIYYLAPELSNVKFVIAARELSIYFAFFLALIFIKKFRLPVYHPVDKIFLLLLLMYSIFIIASIPRFSISSLLMGRELIFPVTTYFVFRYLILSRKQIRKILLFVIGLAFIASVLALIEQVYVNFVNPNLWEQINIAGYLSQKYGSFSGAYPGSWINYLPGLIGRPPGFRSIGIMLDPLVTGHFLACSLVVVLFWHRGSSKWLLAAVIGAGAITTFSKATLLLVFIALSSQALIIRPKSVKQLILGGVVLSILVVGALIIGTGDESFSHFGSFRSGLASLLVSPLGHGVGSTGYFNILVTGAGALEAIDTSFSVYIFQMGLFGLAALVSLVILPFIFLFLDRKQSHYSITSTPLLPVCLPIFGVYSILAFSSAAAFTAVPIFLPMILLGMHISMIDHRARTYSITSRTDNVSGNIEYAR